METEKVIKALSSKTNRRILQLLAQKNMSAPEVFNALKQDAPTYRQSVNKALEALKDCGLVLKYYDDERKGLYYKLIVRKVTIDLKTIEVEYF